MVEASDRGLMLKEISKNALKKLREQMRDDSAELVEANKRLKQQVAERERAELINNTLFRISSAVNTTKNLSDLYISIHRILGEVMNLSNFFIAIYHKDVSKILFPYFVDTNDPVLKSYDPFRTDKSLTGEVITSGKPVFHGEETLRKRATANRIIGTAPKVWLGVPLKIEGEVIGVMATQCYENPHQFGPIDLEILTSVSDQVALAIERKRNEQALIASERRYRNIIESIEEGYFEIDCEGHLTLVNRAMSEMLGYSETELLAMRSADYQDEEARREIREIFQEVLESKQPGEARELEINKENGETKFAETVLTAIRDDKGQLLGFRGIARDVTHRKQEETARRELEEQLQQSQRLESLGTLAGGVAHDFNNLLMGIQGRTSLMLAQLPEDHPDHAQLTSIEECLSSAADLTGRLLGFAQGGKYEVLPIDLNALVEKCISMFGRTRKEVSVNSLLSADLNSIEAAANQMEQVLINLLVNAAQAMPDGGFIEVSTSNVELDSGMAQLYELSPGPYVCMKVSDTGHGMDQATMAKIFDPFFTTKPVGCGTGLGLAMVYGIIRNHSGTISVVSEKDCGTTFTVLLPVTTRKVIYKTEPVEEVIYGSGTVLLVDDEPVIIEVGKKILESIGYTVLTAQSGLDAIALYSQNKNDIQAVIMDMIMPNMSGGELFDRLKRIDPEARILLCSGYSIEGQAQEILDKGCKGFIQKPFSVSQLSTRLREAIGDVAGVRENEHII
ncbi:PAS domain S-box protein [Desulfosediminicola ganghwensis]|uniref:hybrid sensor histidine kinase/response regulator n=1 Tax=Desulfosediminicola ganghwensis TaxID=2569540 RepID=UPI0010AB8FAC|nr:PAS domain S-box protein [Desulfosediminicola ganghwensis]